MTDIKVNPRNHLQVCAEKTVNFGNCCTPFEFNNVNTGLIQADKFCKTRLVSFDFVTKIFFTIIINSLFMISITTL